MHEAAKHPHNVARGTYVERDGLVQAAPAPRFSPTPANLTTPPVRPAPTPPRHSPPGASPTSTHSSPTASPSRPTDLQKGSHEAHLFDADHEAFRDTVRAFCEKEIAPHHEQWEKDSIVPRDVWTKAGELGLLGFMMPEEYGGGGMHDFRFNAVLQEEITRVGASGVGFVIQTDLVSGYLLKYCTDEQKARWFPKFCSGEMITAIAMTEPGTGSDLQGIQTTAVMDGDEYVINGSKTFITNGINADFVIVVCKTDPEAGAMGFSLIAVERGAEGLRARPQPRQDRPQGAGHRRAVLRQRPRPDVATCSARRARASST